MVMPDTSLMADRRRRAAAGPLGLPKIGTHKALQLDLIVDAGARGDGMTDEEMSGILQIPYMTLGPPRRGLVSDGWIVDTGIRRPTARKQPAVVWMISEKGAIQFNLPKGWKEKRTVKRAKAAPKAMTPDERRRRSENDAIKRASELAPDAQFRRDVEMWRQWTGFASSLADRAEQWPVAPVQQEALVMLMEHFHAETGRAIENLRKNSAKPVDMRYYILLGVGHDAPGEVIKDAYRKLARKFHPDATGGDPDKEIKFKEISRAYNVLSDAEERRKYNAYGVAMK